MNILFVCSANTWGGNEKWTSMSIRALSNQHHVYFVGKSKVLLNKFGQFKDAVTLPFSSYVDLYTLYKLKRFIIEKRIDIIVSTKKREYFICGIISKQLKIKHIIRLGANRKMNLPVWHWLNYTVLNDGLITNSNFVSENLRAYDFFANHKIHVLYNGIPNFTSSSCLPGKRLFRRRFVIVSCGRITRLKGYHLLIAAIARLGTKLQEQIEVRIIGEGRNRNEFEQMVTKFCLGGVVRFYGFVDQPADIMKDADLFVLLSEREGISNAILEAMTLGIPVLSTDTGGVREVIKESETGYFVERNVESISTKLAGLIEKRNDIRLVGNNAFGVIRSQFGFDIFEENINKLFNKL